MKLKIKSLVMFVTLIIVMPATGCSKQEQGSLTLIMVVDSMRADELDKYSQYWEGGFKTLLEQGVNFSNAYYSHARTETASGHTTIGTGVTPRIHSIYAKRFYNADLGEVCSFPWPPCDVRSIKAPTIGERIKQKYPDSRVVSIAGKARAATGMAGKAVNLALWVDRDSLRFTGYGEQYDALKENIAALDKETMHMARTFKTWELPEHVSSQGLPSDTTLGETDIGHGTTFPHVLPNIQDDYEKWMYSWVATPNYDYVVAKMAQQIITFMKLGKQGKRDVLFISFSAMDVIGHTFGAQSLERLMALKAVDHYIGDILTLIKSEKIHIEAVGLTADHGMDATVEHLVAQDIDAGRILNKEIEDIVASYLQEKQKGQRLTFTFWDPYITIHGKIKGDVHELRRGLAQAIQAHPHIAAAWDIADVKPSKNEQENMVYENVKPTMPADIVLMPTKHWAIAKDKRGAIHGTPWDHDSHVPLIWFQKGKNAQTLQTRVYIPQLTATVNALFGLSPIPHGYEPLPLN